MVTGVAGSKLASVLFEEYAEFKTHPVSTLFSGSGLTWHGGLILATIAIIWYIKAQKLPLLKMLDLLGPMLAIGYAIGRIGCQLAGDGDYGRPTNLPWAMAYPNGLVPTLEKVHPAPVYETLSGLIIFGILWYLRPKSKFEGMIFSLYLILAGLARYLVEMIRLNPIRFWGMTDAQIVSVTMVILGFVLFFIWGKKGKEHAGSAPNV
jgi:phosphatidylglycerol:prolipoprotein diacylglycerol transferase